MIACSVVLALFSNCLRDFQAISKNTLKVMSFFFNQSFKVAQNMDLECIKIIPKVSFRQDNIDFDAKDSLGWTLFLKACSNGHKEVVKLLFDTFLMIFKHCGSYFFDLSVKSNKRKLERNSVSNK